MRYFEVTPIEVVRTDDSGQEMIRYQKRAFIKAAFVTIDTAGRVTFFDADVCVCAHYDSGLWEDLTEITHKMKE